MSDERDWMESVGAGCALVFFVLAATFMLGLVVLVWKAVL